MTAADRIAAVLARYDTPGMRRDLAWWYDMDVSQIDEIAKGIK